VGTPTLKNHLAISLPPIPNATEEAVDLSHLFRKPRLLIGPEATLQAVQANLSEVEVFHFSGHALALEEQSGLLLASPEGSPQQRDGIATLVSSSGLDFESTKRLQLVVLAACSTGLTARQRKLSPEGLVVPFIASGVPHVVASLWNVDSGVTATTMKYFYGYLLSGESVASALRRAKADIRRDPRTSHPYYWAGFTAFGRT